MTVQHLYIHVPFCTRRRGCCDSAVQVARRPPGEAWLDAIVTEFEHVVATQLGGRPPALRTIYVGGGTPSALGPGAIPELARRLRHSAGWGDDVEWTVEANPEDFDAELAADWRAAGVNRVSLDVESFHETVLRWLERLHGPGETTRAVNAAREAGFDNVNVDLVFGLPGHLGRDWDEDLERALALAPEHVSLYELTAEPGSALGRRVAEGRERLPDEDATGAEYLTAAQRMSDAGFDAYEMSHFARPGCESRHNRAYWNGAAYVGVGPGAHSYLPPVRRWNVHGWDAYAASVSERGTAEARHERVDGSAERLERIWLGLRTASGYSPVRWTAEARERVASWQKRGLAHPGEPVRLTPRGWLLLDRLVIELERSLTAGPAGGGHRDTGATIDDRGAVPAHSRENRQTTRPGSVTTEGGATMGSHGVHR